MLSEQTKEMENTLLFLTFSKVSGRRAEASRRDKRIKSIRRKDTHEGNDLSLVAVWSTFQRIASPGHLYPHISGSEIVHLSQENLRSRMWKGTSHYILPALFTFYDFYHCLNKNGNGSSLLWLS